MHLLYVRQTQNRTWARKAAFDGAGVGGGAGRAENKWLHCAGIIRDLLRNCGYAKSGPMCALHPVDTNVTQV